MNWKAANHLRSYSSSTLSYFFFSTWLASLAVGDGSRRTGVQGEDRRRRHGHAEDVPVAQHLEDLQIHLLAAHIDLDFNVDE